MKSFFIICFCIFPLFIFCQVGVNTTAPTNTLDVAGTLRVRSLTRGVVISNPSGALFTSGNFSIKSGHNTWTDLIVGNKSAVISFAGRTASVPPLGPDFGFVVHLANDPMVGAAGQFIVMSTANCTITNPAPYQLDIAFNTIPVTTHTLIFTRITARTVNIANTGSSPVPGFWLQGAFTSTSY